jgi:putative oxidoreductase
MPGIDREVSIHMAAGFGLLILRLIVGLILAAHGAQKLFGWWGGPGMTGWTGAMTRMRLRPPAAWAWISALGELLGGIGLALGLLTPLPSFAIIASMLVAITLVHWPKGFWVSKGGYEFNVSIIAGALAIALAGPGAYSIDALFGIRLPEPVTLIVVAVATLAGVGVALGTRGPAAENAKQPLAAS